MEKHELYHIFLCLYEEYRFDRRDGFDEIFTLRSRLQCTDYDTWTPDKTLVSEFIILLNKQIPIFILDRAEEIKRNVPCSNSWVCGILKILNGIH